MHSGLIQPVYGVAPASNVTYRLTTLIAIDALKEPIHIVASRNHVSTKTVRDVLRAHGAQLEKSRMHQIPRVMGVDGVYVNKVERFIMTDLENNRVVNLLPTATEEGLKEELPTPLRPPASQSRSY